MKADDALYAKALGMQSLTEYVTHFLKTAARNAS